MSKGRIIAIAVVAVVIIAIAIVGGIFFFHKSSDAEITAFGTYKEGEKVEILPLESKVMVTVPYGTDLTKLRAGVRVSLKATVMPEYNSTVDFSKGPVTYTVTAENGKTVKDWTVSVTNLPNTEAEIISFNVWEADFLEGSGIGQAEIDSSSASVKVKVPYGTDLNLVPGGKVSPGATSDFVTTEKPFDFSKLVTYKVTAQDRKTSKDWGVTVTVAEPTKTIELTKVVLGGQDAVIDTTAHTVRVRLPKDIQLNAVVVTELTGTFGKVKPALAVGDTLDFSKGAKKFTFAAQDMTVKATEKWTFSAYYTVVADTTKAAVIGKGEGVEHAFARQLLANPAAWGYAGFLDNRAAVRKWAGSEAHRIAIKTGYVDYKTHKEIRVTKVGTVYRLAMDGEGKPVVTEYASLEDYEKKNFSDTSTAAPSLKEAKFAGTDEETAKKHVQNYEYVFNPSCQPPVAAAPAPAPCAPAPAPGQVSAPPAGAPGSGGSISVSFDDLPAVPIFPLLE